MRNLKCLLLLILSSQILAQNFSAKKLLIDDLMPIISANGGISLEDIVYCSSLETGKVNFVSHINGKLEFYEYDNFQVSKISGQLPMSTFIVDFVDQNFDGKLDIQGNYDLLINNGNYNFTNSGYPVNGNWNIRAQRIVDFNKDGNFDIISSSISFSSGTLNINFLGPDRKLLDKISFSEAGLIKAVKVLDINKDGLLDLVYTTKKFGDDKLIIQRNLGNNNFIKQEIKVSNTGEQLELGDINNDGFPDIFITGFNGTDIVVFTNVNGAFNNKESLLNTESIFTIKLDDLDQDGKLDIVYLEDVDFDSLSIVVAFGTGSNTLGAVKTIGRVAFKGGTTGQSLQIYENWLSLFDYDKDGDKDILVNAILEKQFVVFDNNLFTSSTLETDEKKDIIIYPNPGMNIIKVDDVGKYEYMEILNINGQILKVVSFNANPEIDLADLRSGIYFFRLIGKSGTSSTMKFIKQ
jgi:hypothetical protein